MDKIKPCPFCGGAGRLSAKDHLFGGWNGFGVCRREYLVKVICNRCKARGGIACTGWVNGTYQQHKQSVYKKIDDKTAFEIADRKAVDAWNRRAEDGK